MYQTMRYFTRKNSNVRRRRGFSLVEAALTTVIIGLGSTALMALLASGSTANQQAAMLTTAIDLANNIHELADRLPYPSTTTTTWGVPTGVTFNATNLFTTTGSNPGNITWLNGQTFSSATTPAGPIDATFSQVSGLSGWSQAVTVSSVSSNNITSTMTNSTTNDMAQVDVTVSYNGNSVYQTSWLVAR